MPEITVPVRAKGLVVEGLRQDKYGKRKPMKIRHTSILSGGAHSGKEMERMIPEVAQKFGVSEDKVKLETYAKDEAPLDTNPRHRVEVPNWSRPRGDRIREVVTDRPIRVRRVWQGGIPKTEEEWAEHVAAFYARQDNS